MCTQIIVIFYIWFTIKTLKHKTLFRKKKKRKIKAYKQPSQFNSVHFKIKDMYLKPSDEFVLIF